MDTSSITLSVLSAMIMPAVLISACGSLVISTNDRLTSLMSRIRELQLHFEALLEPGPELSFPEERRRLVLAELELQTRRAPLLQRVLSTLYLAIGVFIATSVTIGLAALTKASDNWIPTSIGLLGAFCLATASTFLLFETRMAASALRLEMDCLRRLDALINPTSGDDAGPAIR